MSDLEAFRKEARAWLEANCPEEMRRPMREEADICWGGRKWVFQSDAQRIWLERMAERGWTVPTWPRDYGGGGLTKDEARVLKQEMARIRARTPVQSFGIWMLGPAMLQFGAEEQKRTHLPRIARGEIRWAQGYSEPGAGSDLASLKTRVEDKGDHWLVNGSKIWTSYADQCDWIFFLGRTDPDAPKHLGISFILCDMATPGVSTTPIELISGASPFCQTFFDDVKIPKEGSVVGELNRGWDVAKYLLTHEREMIAGMGFDAGARKRVSEIAASELGLRNGALPDAGLRTDIVRHEIDAWAYMLTLERITGADKAGKGVGDVSAMLKYYGTELNKRRQELLMSIGGTDQLEWESDRSDGGKQARSWLRSRANSIEGGTSEIQLNVIAKRVLGLPSA
ncbi:MAG: acyl-CoA dehydrogenase [Alphaproteobacteria bacterium]|nr:MAG: acyl-CoA dehydrogenase [Alphaproteobacteria bacterium]